MAHNIISADGVQQYVGLPTTARGAMLPTGVWATTLRDSIKVFSAELVQLGVVSFVGTGVQWGEMSVTATANAFFVVFPKDDNWSVYEVGPTGSLAGSWESLPGFPFDETADNPGVSLITGTEVMYSLPGVIRGYDYDSETDLGELITKTGWSCRGIILLDSGDWLVGWSADDNLSQGVIVRYNSAFVEQVSWEVGPVSLAADPPTVFTMAVGPPDSGTVYVHVVNFANEPNSDAMQVFLYEDGSLLQTWAGPKYQDGNTIAAPFFVAPAVTGPIDITEMNPPATGPPEPVDPPHGVGYDIDLPQNITVVANAIDALIAEGADLNGGCGAFRITTRVVEMLAGEGLGAGFLKFVLTDYNSAWVRPTQYCGARWSYIVAYPSGAFFYILSGEGDTNHQEWVFGGFAVTSLYVAP